MALHFDAAARDADFLAEVNATLAATPLTAFQFDRVSHFQPARVKRRKHACRRCGRPHGVTDACMTDFVAMTQHRKFNADDLRSGKQVRRTRELFPLLPLFLLDVQQNILPFYDEEGVYTSSTTVEFPFFALADDIIPHLSGQPRLARQPDCRSPAWTTVRGAVARANLSREPTLHDLASHDERGQSRESRRELGASSLGQYRAVVHDNWHCS